MRIPEVLSAAAACLALGVSPCAQTKPFGPPESRSAPVSKAWLPYAQSLVAGDHAVGFVLRESELFNIHVADVPAGVTSTVAESRRGTVTRLVSDGALSCRSAIERPLVPLLLRGTPLSVLYDLVMQDAEASSRMPPGIVGGTVGGATSSRKGGARLGQRIELRVEAGETFEAALDRLVSTSLPFGWGVIEHDDPSTSPCQIVLFTEDTVLMTPYDALSPAPSVPKVLR